MNKIENVIQSDTKYKISGTNSIISATELDSYTDSPVVGKHAYIIETTSKTALVSGFTTELGEPIRVPIVIAAIIYDCEYTGNSHIMIIHNALYFKNMEVNLIPPIIMRIAGLEVDECPKFLSKNPTESNHSIFFPDEDLRIPLLIEGIISYIPTRKPSLEEYNERAGDYLLLTPNLPDWNPHSDVYKDQEYGMLDYNGNIKQGKPRTCR